MMGPDPGELAGIMNAFAKVETVGKDVVNGAPCYSVRMTPKDATEKPSTMCFDTQSGLLVKMSSVAKTQMGTVPIELTMTDYRVDGPIKTPHRIETLAAGQPIEIETTQVVINGELPEHIFDLPPDVAALKNAQ